VRSLEGFEVEGGAEQEAARVAAAADAPPLEVTADNVASVVAQWTGVPVNKLREDESRRMLDFESELHKRVIGQDGAVSSIARALRRARVGLRNPRRPVSSLVFSGPTGVGKTELAKAVAESYYGAEKAMVRIDMSEYMEAHAVSRLTGPPPGYVGYEAGGQLTEAVRRYPHTVVLLDEVEKAHPDVFNVLLQVRDADRWMGAQAGTRRETGKAL
jgi:ATP-dependent Clp protease ATP-binding subunit ClpC